MSLGSILKAIGGWFSKAFNNIKKDAAPVAVTITEFLKGSLDSGLLKTVTDLIPGGFSKEVYAVLQTAIPKALAIELGMEGLPDNATPEQIQAFILSVEQAVGGKSWQEKSAFWTNFSVSIFNTIETDINNSPDHASLSFAQIVQLIEDTYQAYKDSQNPDADNSTN